MRSRILSDLCVLRESRKEVPLPWGAQQSCDSCSEIFLTRLLRIKVSYHLCTQCRCNHTTTYPKTSSWLPGSPTYPTLSSLHKPPKGDFGLQWPRRTSAEWPSSASSIDSGRPAPGGYQGCSLLSKVLKVGAWTKMPVVGTMPYTNVCSTAGSRKRL